MPEQLQKIVDNLLALGARRLAIMGGMAALVIAVIVTASIYLNRPAYETLYVGLDRGDVTRIGVVLGEAGMSYDIGSDGSSVSVAAGQSGRARMILAEKGLPTSSNAGYELFDNVGSLGLTSFMQEVTRVRALEGEIARTIQSIAGIKSARVHIVLAQQANFRREERQPTASVVIRGSGIDAVKTAMSIRHLVAAAVPGLTSDNVTVLDADGTLLAAGDDPTTSTLNRSFGIERTVESQVADNIYRALAPYLGHDNFRASVKAVVNTDTQQIEETIYDPDSRVERSVQIIREADNSNRSGAAAPASVEQNLPDQGEAAGGPQSTEARDRREEITNYELNTKRIATVSNGYSISRLSIAVVVNQERLAAVLGANATQEAIDARVAEIREVVATAAGLDTERGDKITVSAVSFVGDIAGESLAAPGYLEIAGRYTGSMINALAFVVVVFLVSWFGLRPLATALTKPAESAAVPPFEEFPLALGSPLDNIQLPDPLASMQPTESDVMEELKMRLKPAAQERLAQMVELNEERTAAILRKWARGEAVAG